MVCIITKYDKVQIGTPVAVTNSEKSFQQLAKIHGYKIKGGKPNKGVVSVSEFQKKIRELTNYLENNGYSDVEFDQQLAGLGENATYYYFYATPHHDENFKWNVVIKDTGQDEEGYEIKPRTRERRRYN